MNSGCALLAFLVSRRYVLRYKTSVTAKKQPWIIASLSITCGMASSCQVHNDRGDCIFISLDTRFEEPIRRGEMLLTVFEKPDPGV